MQLQVENNAIKFRQSESLGKWFLNDPGFELILRL